MRKTVVVVMGILLTVMFLECAYAARLPKSGNAPIVTLKAGLRTESLNKEVTVEGYYYDGTIPMIVDNIERVGSGAQLPSDCYMPLAGVPEGKVKSGDRITVTGKVEKSDSVSSKWSATESVVLKLTASEGMVIAKTSAKLPVEMAASVPKIDPAKLKNANSYALLIGGGYDYASCSTRWARLMTQTYRLLIAKGYPPQNIIVLYTDGQAGQLMAPVNGSNQSSSIDGAFTSLASRMNDRSTLYILVACPGGGVLSTPMCGYEKGIYGGVWDIDGDEKHDNHSEAALGVDINKDGDMNDVLSVDEAIFGWGDHTITDDNFRDMLNKVEHYSKMIIHLDQAFSGGFIEDLMGPRRVIMTSTSPNSLAPVMKSYLPWTPFSFYYLAALSGSVPQPGFVSTDKVDADMDKDGNVSMAEAYNCGRFYGHSGLYEDNGIFPPQFGALPTGGDGSMGAETSL